MQLLKRHLKHLAISIVFMIEGSVFAQQEPILVPAKFNMSRRVTKSAPNWQIRLHQANERLENTFSERESVLAGTRPDFLGFPVENFAMDANPSVTDWIHGHTFTLDTPLNLNAGETPQGVEENETGIPGIPGFEGNTDYITSEIRFLLEIPQPGIYRFGLHASGGLRVVTGNIHDLFDAVEVASFEGNRAAETVRFDLEFENIGLYQFRTLWFTSEENPSFEWWQLDDEDQQILLNSENGLRTYSDEADAFTSIIQTTPNNGAEGVLLDQNTLRFEILLDSAGIDPESILVSLDEQPAHHTLVTTDTNMTIEAALPELNPFREYVWTLSMKAGNALREVSGRFTTTVFGGTGTLYVEAEDFDFDKGNWDQLNPTGISGPYPGGAYRNRGNGNNATEVDGNSDLGIDYLANPSSNDDPIRGYRTGTGVTIKPLGGVAEDLTRGAFSVISNHVVVDQHEGEWMNYTRNFPASEDGSKTSYNAFVRIATGEEPVGLSLSRVISGHKTSEQETEILAELKSTSPNGSKDEFVILPLHTVIQEETNTESDTLATIDLGGIETLRITSLEGTNQDIDYLLLLPATKEPTTKEPGAIIGFSRSDDQLTIEFTGTLLSSDKVDGDYMPVENAASPFTVTPDQAQAFFIAE